MPAKKLLLDLSMKLIDVTNNATVKEWLHVPWTIYANDPNWIPHLNQDIEKVFDPSKNKLIKDGIVRRWLLRDDSSRPIGRIAAFVNPKTADQSEQPTGGMGFFECINDQSAADFLLDTARDFLTGQGMEAMDGPVNFGEKNQFWGLLIENFEDPPIYQTNYNPRYYKDLLESYGFQLYYKQLFFKRTMSRRVEVVFRRKYRQLQTDPKFAVSNVVGYSMERIAREFCTVYNAAWVDHDGFKPMKEDIALKLMNTMKPVMDKRIIIFVYYDGAPVAFFVNLPELNEIFKHVNGNLNWLGKLKFLYHKKRGTVKTMTGLVFGVVKEWQGKGVESALICYADDTLVVPGHYDQTILTWIGDFNPRMLRVVENLGAENYRTLATYRYLFNRNKPFKRYPIISKKE
jgi:hypothetical protein